MPGAGSQRYACTIHFGQMHEDRHGGVLMERTPRRSGGRMPQLSFGLGLLLREAVALVRAQIPSMGIRIFMDDVKMTEIAGSGP